MPHSSLFIEKMKGKLLEEKKMLENQLARFAKPVQKGEGYVILEENLGSDVDDAATETEINDDNRALEKTLEERLRDVLDALEKIRQGTYGVCEETGEDIPEDRLEALPTARIKLRV